MKIFLENFLLFLAFDLSLLEMVLILKPVKKITEIHKKIIVEMNWIYKMKRQV